ncbi:MAG TPA: hypothetical protein VH813_03340 [Candidatus Limnocylindrales bacterium]
MTRAAILPLVAGLAALVGAIVLAWDPDLVRAIVRPPALVRAAMVAGSVVAGLWLLARAVVRIEASRHPVADRDLPTMVRGVRLAFLAVAAFAAATGWILGHPLPLIVGLVIAGIDVVETSFLLLAAR